jgi:DNA-binding PadR family transcriptional regulator
VKRHLDPLARAIERMGEPSWFILNVLSHQAEPIPGLRIIQHVNTLLQEADYPHKDLGANTLHYALRRMEEDGIVSCTGHANVEVPGPWGTTRTESRPVYAITAAGRAVLARRYALDQAVARRRLSPTFEQPALGGI